MRGPEARRERRVLAPRASGAAARPAPAARLALAAILGLALGCGGGSGESPDRAAAGPADTARPGATRPEPGPAAGEAAPPGSPADAAPAPGAAPDTRAFVNAREGLTGPRADHWVDFAFRYPASWRVVQDGSTPDTPNFVKVERTSDRGTTVESLAIGWFADPAAARGDPDALRATLRALEARLARGFLGFEKTAEGSARIAGREAPGFRFAFRLPPESEVPRAFGRVALVPTGGDDGLALMMFATPLASGVDGPEDVGETGGLVTALGSLELGAAPGDPAAIRPRDLDGSAPPMPERR